MNPYQFELKLISGLELVFVFGLVIKSSNIGTVSSGKTDTRLLCFFLK